MISGEIKVEWTSLRNGKAFAREKESPLKLGKLEQQYSTENVCSEQVQEAKGWYWLTGKARGLAGQLDPETLKILQTRFFPSLSSA